MCCVCFFCLGFLFVWRQLCWVFNILCRFLKGWESKTARNSVLLHAECGPSQCSKLIICTERICYLKKAFQKIHKRFRNPKLKIPCFSRDCCSSVLPKKKKKNVIKSGFWWFNQLTMCKPPSGLVVGGLRLCQRIFYGLQTARGWSSLPLDVVFAVRFFVGRSNRVRETTNTHRETNPGSDFPRFLKLNGAFDSHVFSSQAVKNNHPKSTWKNIPTTTTSTNIS